MDQNQEQPPRRRRVKKSKGHGAHHGGAWKVAYADFVTAMMALFLVLWLVSQADTKLKESIANYFRSPGVFETMDGGILSQAKKVSKEPTSLTSKDDEQTLFAVSQTLQKKFQTRPEFSKYKDQVQVDITEEGLRIQLIDKADQVSFPSGSSELTASAREILEEIAVDICALPNKINIGGHTDRHVFPSEKGYTNWELSADRANAARRLLESVCVKPSQIHRIIGYADTEPLFPDDPFAQGNRRISITVLRLNVPDPEDGSAPDDVKPDVAPNDIGKDRTKPAEKTAKAVKPETAAQSNEADDQRTTEKEKIRKKLKEDGAVKIGEPDEIPSSKKVIQTAKSQ